MRPTRRLEEFFKSGSFNICNFGLPDLRFGHVISNIFVEELKTPLSYSVRINEDTVIHRNISFSVRIFDFDHSAKMKTPTWNIQIKNTLLDSGMCRMYGGGNQYREKLNADWFTILYFAYMSTKSKGIEKIVHQELVVKPVLQRDYITGTPVGDNPPIFPISVEHVFVRTVHVSSVR